MTKTGPLLKLNAKLDWEVLGSRFREQRRLQVRDVLEPEAAQRIASQLAERTPWGLAWKTPDVATQKLDANQVAALGPQHHQAMKHHISGAMSGGGLESSMRGEGFSFLYGQYLLHDRYVLGAAQDPFFDQLVEELNGPAFLDHFKAFVGRDDIGWVDSQATLYAPGHFLTVHQDDVEGQTRVAAYVLNLCTVDWRPDWGGYLNFFDDDGNITDGYRPLFNSLNIFLVPQHHHVSFVPGFAPNGRFAITGWFRSGERPFPLRGKH